MHEVGSTQNNDARETRAEATKEDERAAERSKVQGDDPSSSTYVKDRDKPQPPNILLIMVDDTGEHHVIEI